MAELKPFYMALSKLRAPRGCGEQGNLPFLLMETWEFEKIFQGNLGSKWSLGSNSAFLLREQSKNSFVEIREVFEIFIGNTGTQTPAGHSGPRMRLCGNLGVIWSIFLVRGTPHFDCVKPDSSSNRNSLHYLYEGYLGLGTLLDTYCANWGRLVEEKDGVEKVWI